MLYVKVKCKNVLKLITDHAQKEINQQGRLNIQNSMLQKIMLLLGMGLNLW